MIRFVIVIVYILLGVFFMGMLTDSSERHSGSMLLFWPIFVSFFIIFTILNIVFYIGEKIGNKIDKFD